MTIGRDWNYTATSQGMPRDREGFHLRAFGGNTVLPTP